MTFLFVESPSRKLGQMCSEVLLADMSGTVEVLEWFPMRLNTVRVCTITTKKLILWIFVRMIYCFVFVTMFAQVVLTFSTIGTDYAQFLTLRLIIGMSSFSRLLVPGHISTRKSYDLSAIIPITQ